MRKRLVLSLSLLLFIFVLNGCSAGSGGADLRDGMSGEEFLAAPGNRVWICTGGFKEHDEVITPDFQIKGFFIQKGETGKYYTGETMFAERYNLSDIAGKSPDEIINIVENNSLYENVKYVSNDIEYRLAVGTNSLDQLSIRLEEVNDNKKPGTNDAIALVSVGKYSNKGEQGSGKPGTFGTAKNYIFTDITSEINQSGVTMSGFAEFSDQIWYPDETHSWESEILGEVTDKCYSINTEDILASIPSEQTAK